MVLVGRHFALGALLAWSGLGPALGAEAPPQPMVDQLVRDHMEARRIPGASIAVIDADGTAHLGAYGQAVLQNDVPARVDTVYEIASLTKQFTATAVLMLCDEGSLDLEASISEYVELPSEPWSRITLRQLLTHTGGLASQDDEFASLKNDWRRYTTKQQLLDSVLDDRLQSAPGEAFSYGNAGYFLAALAVERASGLSFAEFLHSRILKPLGMNHTLLQDELRIIPHEAQGYSLKDGRLVNIWRDSAEEVAGGWGLFSSIPDLILWERAIRNRELLSREAYEAMFTPVGLPEGPFRYGLGWWLPERNGISYQYHSGITGTEILRVPSRGLTVIVLSNLGRSGAVGSDEANPWGLADLLASAWIPEFSLQTLDLPLSPEELPPYTGRWRFRHGEAEFSVHEGRLWIEDEAGRDVMLYQGNDVFGLDGDSEQLQFQRSNQGEVLSARWFGEVVEDDPGVRISPALQTPPPRTPPTRPRIGLVLSGGGALGSAHVGVLKVLEELKIPVDLVAGTSMGALVGGLYASGVSPAQLEQILIDTDWRRVLDDRPPRRQISYRQKVDDQTFLADFEAGFNGGQFSTPPGLISGQNIGPALRQMALKTTGITDFDELPIPFRAVATDLATGEVVVLSRGDLPQAMRASMSVPGIFSPIEMEGRLLVDGGLGSNLPVDIALAMGADVIIAVDVGEPLLSRDELDSINKVTSQTIGLQMRSNVEDQATRADVLIRPDLDGYGNSQFSRGSEMIPAGEIAARTLVEELSQYSVSAQEYARYIERIRKERSFEHATVRSVQLTSSSTSDPQFVLGQVKTRAGDPLDLEAIHEDLERLFDTGDFERIDLGFRKAGPGESYDLFIEAIDKSWGPNYLRFGLNQFTDFEGESSFDLLTSYTLTHLNRRRAELKIELLLGENSTIETEFYQPFDSDQTWFGAVSLHAATTSSLVPTGGGTLASYQSDLFSANADLGYQMGRFGELRVGFTHGSLHSDPRDDDSGTATALASLDHDFGGLTASVIIDQFDNMNFPQEGYFAATTYFAARESLGSETDYERLVGFVGAAATRGRHTLLGLSNFFSALGSESPELYELGGLFKLSGVPAGSVSGQYGGSLAVLYLNRVADLPTGLGNGLYAGFSIEGGNLWNESSAISLDDLHPAGSVFLGADTVFGPLYFAQGLSENDQTFYFFLGRSF